MGVYRRALRYFKPDSGLIAALLALIGVQTVLGLLAVWPMAVLVDSVLTTTPKNDGIRHLFLAVLPRSQVGQVLGLA